MNNFKKTLLAVALFSVVTACGSAEDSSARFLESGKTLMAEGEYEKARLELRNAIQINPTEAEAYYQLSLIDEKAQKWREMYANLRTADSLDPNNPKVIVKLGQILVISGQVEEAMSSAERALTLEPENIEAILLLANIHIKQENYGQAQKEIERALTLDATSVEALSYRVMLYKEMRRYADALAAADKALAIHPDAMPIKMLQLTIYEEQKNYAEMERLYREILPEYPEETWVVFSLAKLLNDGLNRHQDARNELIKFIEANPEHTEAKLVYIQLVLTKDVDEAIAELDKFIVKQPETSELRFAKIDLLFQQGKSSEAKDDLNAIAEANPNSEEGLRARANLAIIEASEDNFDQAEKLVDDVLAVSAENEVALLLKAKLQLRKNQVDPAISNLRTLVRNNPASDEALVLLAQAYTASGATQLADSNFRQALSANPQNLQAALTVAQTMIQANDLDRAETVLITALRGNTENQELLQILAQVKLLKQDWAGTDETLQRLGTTSAVKHMLSAQMYQGLGDYSLAIIEYEKALIQNPELTQALQALAVLHMQAEQGEQAINYLQQHINNHPDLINGYAVLASIYREQSDIEKAIDTIENGMTTNPNWIDGYRFIADLHGRAGNRQQVLETYQRGVDAHPENLSLMMQLASSQEVNGNFEQARDLYEKVLARDPSQDIAANNLASLLSDQFETPENLERAMTIASRFRNSEQPYFADTYGWVNFKLGNYEAARPALERAAQEGADVAIFHYHLARLYKTLQLNDQATTSLQTAKRLATEQTDEKLLQRISEFD